MAAFRRHMSPRCTKGSYPLIEIFSFSLGCGFFGGGVSFFSSGGGPDFRKQGRFYPKVPPRTPMYSEHTCHGVIVQGGHDGLQLVDLEGDVVGDPGHGGVSSNLAPKLSH